MSWDQYSQTPASNYVAPYAFTGMAPSLVKVAISNVMADLSQFMSLPTSGGTANAQTVTNTRQFGALFAGMRQSFIPGNTNTGAVTFAPDGLTAKNVFANGVAAIAGMLVATVPVHMQYDGTQWNLVNPQSPTGSFTGTGTGLTTSPTCTIKYCITSDDSTCTLTIATGVTGTSNAATFTITGGPTAIQPKSTQALNCYVEDNGADTNGIISISGGGATISLGKGSSYGPGGFTTSGTKAFPHGGSFSMTYQLGI